MDHSGHRARLKRALRTQGLMAFAPHEVTELILYSALPRRDVNELAHRLTDTFGGVPGVLNAAKPRLMNEGGLTEHTADIIMAVGGCVRAYAADTGENDVYIRTRQDAERLAARFPGAYMSLLSSGRRVIFASPLPQAEPERFIYSHAVLYDASSVLLTHAAGPHDELRRRLKDAGVELLIC